MKSMPPIFRESPALSEYFQLKIAPLLNEDNRNLTPATTSKSSLARTKKTKPDVRVIEISYEHFEQAIISHLITFGAIKPTEEVLWTDIDIELNEKGLIEIEVAVEPAQLSLPLGDPLGR